MLALTELRKMLMRPLAETCGAVEVEFLAASPPLSGARAVTEKINLSGPEQTRPRDTLLQPSRAAGRAGVTPLLPEQYPASFAAGSAST